MFDILLLTMEITRVSKNYFINILNILKLKIFCDKIILISGILVLGRRNPEYGVRKRTKNYSNPGLEGGEYIE